jgi:hypothetical protein
MWVTRGEKLPDLTEQLGPHPRLAEFRSAPGLALVAQKPGPDDDCVRSVTLSVTHAFRGSLRPGTEVTMRLPSEVGMRRTWFDKTIVAYRDEAEGPLLLAAWGATADALVVATMVTGGPVPEWLLRGHYIDGNQWHLWLRRHNSAFQHPGTAP